MFRFRLTLCIAIISCNALTQKEGAQNDMQNKATQAQKEIFLYVSL